MAGGEDGLGNGHSSLGAVVGVVVAVCGFASAVVWHVSGGRVSLPLAWLMTPVPPGVFQLIMCLGLAALLAFAGLVKFLDRDNAEVVYTAQRPNNPPSPPPTQPIRARGTR